MEVVLWILQVLLAVTFGGAGGAKLATPREQLVADPRMGWTQDFSAGQIKTIGALEALAAVGLILPAALGVAGVLTGLAAAGLVLTMLGAAATHLRRGERQMVVVNVVLLALALFVAIERVGPHAA